MQQRLVCPLCKREIQRSEGVVKCPDCESDFVTVVVGGWREGALEKLVEEYKYQSVWAMGEALAEVAKMACEKYGLDGLDGEVVVVPLPTIGRHVRERGLDHTLKVAKKLARLMGWKCGRYLKRATDSVQVGMKAADRQEQARLAYEVCGQLDAEKKYVLLDDVWTTGSSMRAAAEVMKGAGAKEVYGVVLAVGRKK